MDIDKKKYMLYLLKEKIISERKAKEADEELTRLFGDCRHIPVAVNSGDFLCACCGKRVYEDDFAAYGKNKIYAGFINEKENSLQKLYERRMQIVQDLILDTWSDSPELTKYELMYEVGNKIRKRYLKLQVSKSKKGENNKEI